MQIDVGDALELTIEEIIGQRIAVLGISGSGKTNTVAVLAEELLPHLPVTICDIEGEYYGLKERFDILVAGQSEHAEVPLFKENAASLAEVSIRRGISIILDLSEYEPGEMQDILLAYFERLWHLSSTLKSPYEIIIEEAHEFIPQGTRTPLKSLLTRFALRGRKRGVGVIMASQRSSKVEKDLLTQANILLLHNVVHPIDLSVYKDLIPLPGKEVEQQVRDLALGSAFLIRGKQRDRIQVRKRSTFHAGSTPALGENQLHLRTIDTSLLEELRAIATRSVKEGESDEGSRLRKQLHDAAILIEQKEAEIAELKKRLELVSTLRVEMPDQALSLPDIMHIERATVDQLYAPVAASPRIVESAVILPSGVATSSEPVPIPLNEGKLQALQTWFGRKTTPHQRWMLKVLHEQGKPMDTYEISSWTNNAESVIRNQAPLELVQRSILNRTMIYHRGYRYTSALKPFLAREFPGADKQALIERVLSWCR